MAKQGTREFCKCTTVGGEKTRSSLAVTFVWKNLFCGAKRQLPIYPPASTEIVKTLPDN